MSTQTSSMSNMPTQVRPASTTLSIWQRIPFDVLWQRARKTLRGQFIVLAFSNLFVALVLAVLVSQAFSMSAGYLDTINTGSIPSVNAAQAMAQYIDDIDARAADYLATAGLTALEPCTITGSANPPAQMTVHACDDLNINAEIVLANRQLYAAAHNVTYPGERTAVERITAGFEQYTADITVMRHEFDMANSKTDPNDAHLQKARQAYLDASDVLHKHIDFLSAGTTLSDESNIPSCTLPDGAVLSGSQWPQGGIDDNVDCLSAINHAHLDDAYSNAESFLNANLWFLLLLCLIFCGLVGYTTFKMMRWTHRAINIGLSLACLVSIIFSIVIAIQLSGLAGGHGAFKQMVQDDYMSVYDAALLKRYGTDANADESRWLIAKEFGDTAQADLWQQDWQKNVGLVQHWMSNAVANHTWDEETQPLTDMQNNWDTYYAIDGKIRSTANNTSDPNHILKAEQLSTGQSNAAFGNFANAVDQLAQANQGHYDTTYAATQSALASFTLWAAVLFPVLGVLAAWGVWLRLKEF